MQAVILAAGRGSRLHPITVKRSKAMLPILGKPIIERVMQRIATNGIRDFIVVVSPEDRDITHYFQHESRLEAEIRFVYQPDRQGVADALRWAAPLIEDEFLQSACDNLVSSEEIAQMLTLWRMEPRPNAVLSLVKVPPEDIPKTGIVDFDGTWVRRIIEKPNLDEAPSDIASMPLYCFGEKILEYISDVPLSKRGEYEIQPAIQTLIDRHGGVRGMLVASRLTLTTAADLLAINQHFLMSGGDHPQITPQAVGPNTKLVTPLYIEQGTIIGANCVIGPNVYIERDCRIEDGVSLQDAIVLREAVISEGKRISNQVVS